MRARNVERSRHDDANFTFGTKQQIKDVVNVFGDKVAFLSIDDKSKVPIGVTAAIKQAPLAAFFFSQN